MQIHFRQLHPLVLHGFKRLHFFFRALILQINHNNTFILAKGLAFSFITCMVPVVLILFAVAGYVLEGEMVEEKLHEMLMQLIPYPDSVEYIQVFLIARISEFAIHKTTAAWVGIVGLLWAASGLFANMRGVLNKIFKRKSKRHFMFGKLKDLLMVVFVLIFFLMSMWIVPFLELLRNFADSLPVLKHIQLEFIHQFLLQLVPFGLLFVILFFLFYLIPSGRMQKRIAVISAFSTTLFGFIAQKVFLFYVSHASGISRVYGTYVLGVLILFWLYYSSVVFIIGAEIGHIFQKAWRIRQSFKLAPARSDAAAGHKAQDETFEAGP